MPAAPWRLEVRRYGWGLSLPAVLGAVLIACISGDAAEPGPTSTSLPTATVLAAAPRPAATPALPDRPAPEASEGIQVTLVAARDTTMFESDTSELANGAGDALFVGRNRGGRVARALVYFDVAPELPAGATILEATLTLRSSRAATGSAIVSLHPVIAAWGEGGSAATRGEGSGAPAEPGDATWTYRLYPDTAWTAHGGDFGTAVAQAQFGEEVATYSWTGAAVTAQVGAGWTSLSPTWDGCCARRRSLTVSRPSGSTAGRVVQTARGRYLSSSMRNRKVC